MTDAEFTKLYLAVQPTLAAYARKLAKDRDAAEDLLQDANVRIWSKRHLYVEGNFLGWTKVLLRNVFYNQQEVESRMKFTDWNFAHGDLLDKNGMVNEEQGWSAEMNHKYFSVEPNQEDYWLENRIMEAIATLPSHTALLIQKRLQGMEYKKIAKALGITPNNAKQRHFNDTKTLRKLLLDLGLAE